MSGQNSRKTLNPTSEPMLAPKLTAPSPAVVVLRVAIADAETESSRAPAPFVAVAVRLVESGGRSRPHDRFRVSQATQVAVKPLAFGHGNKLRTRG